MDFINFSARWIFFSYYNGYWLAKLLAWFCLKTIALQAGFSCFILLATNLTPSFSLCLFFSVTINLLTCFETWILECNVKNTLCEESVLNSWSFCTPEHLPSPGPLAYIAHATQHGYREFPGQQLLFLKLESQIIFF